MSGTVVTGVRVTDIPDFQTKPVDEQIAILGTAFIRDAMMERDDVAWLLGKALELTQTVERLEHDIALWDEMHESPPVPPVPYSDGNVPF